MPANLTPQYLEAEKRYRLAKTVPEKLEALEMMLALIPKHKGTDKLQGEIKRKISKLRGEFQKKRSSGRRNYPFHVEKEGAAQLILFGFPNVGKSELLAAVTNASSEIADYAYTTKRPRPGMMTFEDIQFQLVDGPAFTDSANETGLFYMVRNGDLILAVLDLTDEPVLQLEMIFDELDKRGIRVAGKGTDDSENNNNPGKKLLIVGNKLDMNEADAAYREVVKEYGAQYNTVAISARTRINLEEFKKEVYKASGIIRLYTKMPGKKPDLGSPFVLKKGSNVLDLARMIHKDFVKRLKYARIWGSEKYQGQKVKKEHVLEDGDIIELHV
nr:TGS domain-containing protein [Desulfobacterales bacterium]